MQWALRSIGVFGVAASLALVPQSGTADTFDQPFLVTTSSTFSDTTTSSRNIVLLHGDAPASTITGATSSDTLSLMRDRSCVAVIERILGEGAARTPYPIGVALDDAHVVSVPVTAKLAQPGSGARLIEATGDTTGIVDTGETRVEVGIHVDARVLARNGKLEAATFRQVTYVTTPTQAIHASACSVQRLPVTTAPAAVTSMS